MGCNGCKGIYNIASPIDKTFFEIFIERVKNLCELAKTKYPNPHLNRDPIVIYILVNDKASDEVYQYFEANKYFGYATIRFYEVKAEINVFDESGRIPMKNETEVLKTSFGNGRFIR